MSLENYLNKMKSHKQDMNTKLSYWETEKQKGSKGETITRDFLRKHQLDFKEQKTFSASIYICNKTSRFFTKKVKKITLFIQTIEFQ